MNDDEAWACAAVTLMLRRCAERVARTYEREASALLLNADRVRRPWR